jgi:hypothetical protein
MTLARRPNNSLTTKPDQNLTIRQARSGESDFVPHLRIDEVQQLAREADDGKRGSPMFFFACEKSFTIQEPTTILNPIGQTPLNDAQHPLLPET